MGAVLRRQKLGPRLSGTCEGCTVQPTQRGLLGAAAVPATAHREMRVAAALSAALAALGTEDLSTDHLATFGVD